MLWYIGDRYQLEFELRDPVNYGTLLDLSSADDIIFKLYNDQGIQMTKTKSNDDIIITGTGKIQVDTGEISLNAGLYRLYITITYSDKTITPVTSEVVVVEKS